MQETQEQVAVTVLVGTEEVELPQEVLVGPTQERQERELLLVEYTFRLVRTTATHTILMVFMVMGTPETTATMVQQGTQALQETMAIQEPTEQDMAELDTRVQQEMPVRQETQAMQVTQETVVRPTQDILVRQV
jgi:hypothetical protein